jgi:hypothetical protein
MGSGLDDYIYWHFFQLQSIMTAHNQWLSTTRSIPYWTTSVFSSIVTNSERRISWTELTSRRTEYKSPCLTVPLLFPVSSVATKRVSIPWQRLEFSKRVRCRENMFTELLLSSRLFRLAITETCVSGPLANNGLFRLSGVMPQYKNIRTQYPSSNYTTRILWTVHFWL